MTIREHFEESARNKGLVVRRVFGDEAEAEGLNDGDYLFQETRLAWDWFQSAWGASLAALVVKLPCETAINDDAADKLYDAGYRKIVATK